MNVVYLSPHFPANQYLYCRGLREAGIAVLGIGEADWGSLTQAQRESMNEYYRAASLEDSDAVRRIVREMIARYGRLDRVESHNEHWLDLEARLRVEFGIPGRRPEELADARRKSRMKEKFVRAGIPVARGRLATTPGEARAFAREVGYPIVAKPDIGVGAAGTYRISDDEELSRLLETTGGREYFVEEYIAGTIVTFDGLADREGRPVHGGSLEYSRGVMETVNEDLDIYYFTRRRVPPDLRDAGLRILREFRVREGFFHLEFFRTHATGDLVALEANLRPPGGYTIDMYNYAADIDLYRLWGLVVAGRPVDPVPDEAPYYCCYISRKGRIRYRHDHDAVLARTGGAMVLHTAMPEIFRRGMGDYAYVVRTRGLDELTSICRFVQERA